MKNALRLTVPALVLGLVAAVLAAAPPDPGPAFPDTVEGRRLQAFFAAAEKRDPAATRAFIEANFPPEALQRLPLETRLSNIHGFIERNAPFEILRVLPVRPDSAGVIARARTSGRVLEISLELEEAPRRGVLGLHIEDREPEAAQGDLAPETPKANDAELAAAVEAEVGALAARDAFSGVVLLARGGKPFYQRAFGLADRGFGVANRVDTKFNIGSIGKAITRAAIMDLVRSQRLALTDTIAMRLPGTKVPSADRITVAMLLDMTSGLGDIFGKRFAETPKENIRELKDYLALFETDPLRFEPGQGRAYSNAGYVVLGLMIEKVSGRPYWDFVRERILTPAGMVGTSYAGPDEVVANRAIGYAKLADGTWRSNVYELPGRPSSAGGVAATAADLLAFALFVPDPRAIAGGTPGANAVLDSAGKDGVTIVVLANLDPPAAERLARRIRAWAPRGDRS